MSFTAPDIAVALAQMSQKGLRDTWFTLARLRLKSASGLCFRATRAIAVLQIFAGRRLSVASLIGVFNNATANLYFAF